MCGEKASMNMPGGNDHGYDHDLFHRIQSSGLPVATIAPSFMATRDAYLRSIVRRSQTRLRLFCFLLVLALPWTACLREKVMRVKKAVPQTKKFSLSWRVPIEAHRRHTATGIRK